MKASKDTAILVLGHLKIETLEESKIGIIARFLEEARLEGARWAAQRIERVHHEKLIAHDIRISAERTLAPE